MVYNKKQAALYRERNRERIRGQNRASKARHRDPNTPHKLRHKHRIGRPSPTYYSWIGMHQRCRNPNSSSYPSYGARGITICKRWFSFENFLADMGERPVGKTLNRLNGKKGYSPANCAWSTPKEQAANRRKVRPLVYHWDPSAL